MARKIVTEEEFQKTISSGKVLIDFYADWCGPCKMIAPIIDEISKDLEGKVDIAKINSDDFEALSASYQVNTIPSLILFVDGKEVGRKVGYLPKAKVLEFIETGK